MEKETLNKDFIKMEQDILAYWEKEDVFNKMCKKNENTGKHRKFLDGPITANNAMGVHHAWNRSLKDIMLKYWALNGYSAHYQNGFDAQGLWVEVEEEKALGLKDKRDIVKFGIDKFTESCMNRVKKYSKIITEQSKRLGQWMDWEHSYFTNTDENITSIWYFLKECNKKGWLTQKYRPMPWCPHCGTSLSEHELADSYKDVEHIAVFFKLPIVGENARMLVWTTTPWTLSSNVAIAVNPELEYAYCKVKSDDKLIVVCKTATKVLKDDIVSIEKVVKGSELVGKTYETCFPELEEQQFEHKIVAWDEVDSTEGSGAVHIAPGCGAEDFELGQSLGLPNVCPVDENGIFTNNFGFLSGKTTDEARDLVFDRLKQDNKLYYTHKYTHRYPNCWRCKNPIIFRLTKEWYIKADEIRPQLIKAVDTVEWQPEFTKKRMLDWLNNMGDWSISRKRFYGLPLPFYVCPDCGEITVVGSLDELKKLSSAEEVDALPHLHRPYIDKIKITCPKCGAKVSRITEVGDCWLDAGITPFSTKKYFTDRKFWENNFPADCVIEMKEQIRLWFYSLLFMSVTLTGKAPYKKVVAFASLVAEDGSKFSKSGKNNITFEDAANKIGSDVIRYMFASNNMLNDTRFGYGVTDEIRRKLLGLWNAYVFFNTYAVLDNPKIDGFVPQEKDLDITDKWLMQKVNNFIKNSHDNYANNRNYLVIKEFEELIDDLTNWYIRINRKRFWKSDDENDKLVAYYCLYNAIKKIAQVMAPITPFMSEYIWQKMVREVEKDSAESLFLNEYATPMTDKDYSNLIDETEKVRAIITLANRLRNEHQIKVKQPLKEMFLVVEDDYKNATKDFETIIKDEVNIKTINFVENSERFNVIKLGVNFKKAGAVLKGDVNRMKQTLLDSSADEMAKMVKGFDSGKVEVKGFEGTFDSDLFVKILEPKTEFAIANLENNVVVLDIEIDEELMKEGLIRDLVRSLQVLRKEANYNIEDRIYASITTEDETMKQVIESNKEKIMQDVLIKEIKNIANPDIEKTIAVQDVEVLVKYVK